MKKPLIRIACAIFGCILLGIVAPFLLLEIMHPEQGILIVILWPAMMITGAFAGYFVGNKITS